MLSIERRSKSEWYSGIDTANGACYYYINPTEYIFTGKEYNPISTIIFVEIFGEVGYNIISEETKGSEQMSNMEQAKRRNRKIYITDIAIEKVPFIEYHRFDNEKSKIMQELAKNVLILSKEENDSNEVAITCDLGTENPLEQYGISLGTEHEVDILSDTLSNHIIVSQESVAVVVLHNHPSTQTFSLQDIQFFLEYPMLVVIVVVSNQGTVHYMMRDKGYDYKNAFQLFRECIADLTRNSPIQEQYLAALSFLAKCSEVGLYYR